MIRRALVAVAIAAAVAAVVVGLATTVTPPSGLVRRLATNNAEWLLSNYMEVPGSPGAFMRNGARKTLAMYVQYGLAAEFRRRHPMPTKGSDAERVFAQLTPLRAVLLNQTEAPHAPEQWAPLLSGVGFCDQLNAMAANVLGAEFKHAQIIALADPATRAEHTIGRVWSGRDREWIYFDIWGPITVFRLDAAGRPSLVASRDLYPGAVDSMTLASLTHIYKFAAVGHVLNEYPATLAAFLAGRLGRALNRGTLDSFAPIYAATLSATPSVAIKPPPSGPQTRRLFATAQVARLFGDSVSAVSGFLRVAAYDSTSVLGRAAARIVTRSRGGV